MEFDLWQAGLLVAVGAAAGFLNVMAGGGSLLTVPVMVFMGLPGPVANGTNRIAILAQNITAIATFARRGFGDFRLSMTLAACALPGAVVGAMGKVGQGRCLPLMLGAGTGALVMGSTRGERLRRGEAAVWGAGPLAVR